MKQYNSTNLMLIASVLVLASVVYENANAAPSLGNYSLADGVYREVLVSGSPDQVSNEFYFHDGILDAYPDDYGTKYGGVTEGFIISEAITLVESGADYDVFKTGLNEGSLFIDGEIWGESNNSLYNIINLTAEIRSTIFSDGNVAKELLVLGDIEGYSNYTASFNATLIETGSEPYLGKTSVIGNIQNAHLEIAAVPEPASIGLIGLVLGGIYFTRRFFVV